MKRTLAVLLAMAGLVVTGSAQTSSPAKNNPTGSEHKAEAAQPPSSGLPSEAEVNAFLHRTFGYDQNLVFKIAEIKPSKVRGLAEVNVAVSTPEGQRLMRLYVVEGQGYAIAGDMVPFGADPFAKDRETLNKQAFGPTKGATTPVITLVEFADLECPACKQAQPVVEKLVSEEPKVRLIFQNFPLTQLHPWADKAAAYLDCIARENNDAAWKFIDAVYQQQDTVDQQNQAGAAALTTKLNELATSAGADANKVVSCAALPETKARIDRSRKLGDEVGVTATPTLFVNGRKIGNAASIPYEALKAVVDFEISETK